VTDLDLKAAVSQIVREGGSALLGRALGVDSSNAQQAAEQRAQQVQADAEKRAQAEMDAAKQKAAADAEAERKKLEDEARNRLKGLFGK
jgi:AsmA protein